MVDEMDRMGFLVSNWVVLACVTPVHWERQASDRVREAKGKF